jgi:hypothetical protein
MNVDTLPLLAIHNLLMFWSVGGSRTAFKGGGTG